LNQADEYSLIRRVLAGETPLFAELVSVHQQRTFRIVLAVVGDYHEAEDLTQEAFIRAFQRLGTFGFRGCFAGWIHQLAVRVALGRRRSAASHAHRPHHPLPLAAGPLEPADQQPAPQQVAQRQEEIEQLRVALDRLPADRRLIIALRDLEGFDYEQIGQLIGCPVGTVRSRLHRARLELRELLRTESPLERQEANR
jgi:RNA polymerase sigma-70 factor, ECF subfamily